MKEILVGTDILMLIGAIVSIVVLIAMMIDLASGWQKAKQRDEAHNSYALSRTLNKFLLYEGGVIIALGIDLLLHLAHFWSLLGIDLLASVPVVAILIGIYLCVRKQTKSSASTSRKWSLLLSSFCRKTNLSKHSHKLS